MSSTALHWLPAEALSRLYRDLAQLLPPGGVFLNADHLPYGPTTPTLAQVSEHTLDELWSDESFAPEASRRQNSGGKPSPNSPGWRPCRLNGLDASTAKRDPSEPPSTTTSRPCELPASARPAQFGRPSRTKCYSPCGKTLTTT